MTRTRQVPINKAVLSWAIQTSGLDDREVASRLKVNTDILRGWLSGPDQPKISEFRSLVKVLRRPSATFFLPRPPQLSHIDVQFRQLPGAVIRSLFPEERVSIRDAEHLQRTIKWLQQELGDINRQLPQITIGVDAEQAALETREFLDVSTEHQFKWSSNSAALKEWRDTFEESGILVFLMSMGAKSARGFSIWDDTAPLIAVNTHWNPAARIYTLFHELGHLLTRTSSICANYGVGKSSSSNTEIERWCEQFGAATLMPKDAFNKSLDDFRVAPHGPITDLDIPRKLAARFHVSMRAATLRLIGLGRATWSLYRMIPPVSDSKSGGRGKGRTRAVARVDKYGRRATEVFLRGLKHDVINASDIMHYLNVSYSEIAQLEMIAS